MLLVEVLVLVPVEECPEQLLEVSRGHIDVHP
jgi:hypothetical protein